MTPGWTTASRSSGSIDRISDIAVSDSTTQPSMAFAPPDSPVPAPRGTTGARWRRQISTTRRTSSVLRARTTAVGFADGCTGRLIAAEAPRHVGVDDDPPLGERGVQIANDGRGGGLRRRLDLCRHGLSSRGCSTIRW